MYGVRQPSVTADPLTYEFGPGVDLRNIPVKVEVIRETYRALREMERVEIPRTLTTLESLDQTRAAVSEILKRCNLDGSQLRRSLIFFVINF